MKSIKKILILTLLFVSSFSYSQNVEIAFCLDLSGSTNGVMDRFRADFWDVINNIGEYKNNPKLKVAVVGFGSPAFGKKYSYIRTISDFTSNIDEVAYKVYKQNRTTTSGNTYVDKALAVSLKTLKWSKGNTTTKILFLIGNGAAGTMMFQKDWFLKQMANKGVRVVPVYLSKDGYKKGLEDWMTFSESLGASFKKIDLDLVSETSVNQRVVLTNKKYNSTLVYFGKKGLVNYSNYLDLDSLISFTSPQAIHGRFSYKISDFYHNNSSWDLVDLATQKQVDFSNINKEGLPDKIAELEVESIAKLVERKSKERHHIVTRIKLYNMSVKYKEEEKELEDVDTLKGYIIALCNQQISLSGYTK